MTAPEHNLNMKFRVSCSKHVQLLQTCSEHAKHAEHDSSCSNMIWNMTEHGGQVIDENLLKLGCPGLSQAIPQTAKPESHLRTVEIIS